MTVKLQNYTKGGKPFWNLLTVSGSCPAALNMYTTHLWVGTGLPMHALRSAGLQSRCSSAYLQLSLSFAAALPAGGSHSGWEGPPPPACGRAGEAGGRAVLVFPALGRPHASSLRLNRLPSAASYTLPLLPR